MSISKLISSLLAPQVINPNCAAATIVCFISVLILKGVNIPLISVGDFSQGLKIFLNFFHSKIVKIKYLL